MKHYKCSPVILAAAMFIASCSSDKKDESPVVTPPVQEEPSIPVYNVTGQAVGADFSGSTVTVTGAAEPLTVTADADGSFTLPISIEDDKTDSVVTIKVVSATDPRIVYTALYNGFGTEEAQSLGNRLPFTATASAVPGGLLATAAATADSNQVTVSAVSTALYALLVSANSGTAPATVEQLVFTEKSIDPSALIEAAALVKIFTEDPDLELPQGIEDITGLLTDVAAYNVALEQIEQVQPGLIASTIDDIVNDPELTPPVTVLPELYFRTAAAAPGFLSRSGDRWQFAGDGSGSLAFRFGISNFQWVLDNGKIIINYDEPSVSTNYPQVSVNVAGLTAEQVECLYNDNITQVRVDNSTVGAALTRLTTGQVMDTYRMVSTVRQTLAEPVATTCGDITTEGSVFESSSNMLMRKVNNASAVFSTADMPGVWALNSYFTLSFINGDVIDFYLDPLSFNAGGTGQGLDTGRSFSWQVDSGLLDISFDDGTRLQAQVLDQLADDWQVFILVTNQAGEVIAAQADYTFKIPEDVSFADVDFINDEGSYWQTTINQWNLGNWESDRLLFCYNDAGCNEDYPQINYFGWQFSAANAGQRASAHDGFPPEFSPVFNPQYDNLSWSLTTDNTLSFFYNNCDSDQPCRNRQWQLLKVSEGLLGTRIYVIEEEFGRYAATDNYGFWIGTRLNIYEQISYDYWNETAEVETSALGTVTAIRNVLSPTGNQGITP